MVADAPTEAEAMPKILEFIEITQLLLTMQSLIIHLSMKHQKE